MADGRVEFEITADDRKAEATIDQVTTKLQQSGAKWEKSAKESTDKIGGSFEGMLKKVAAALSAAAIGKALLDIGKQAIQAASDLAEVQNVVDVAFGEKGAAQVEKWAQQAGKQFGLTETQAKRFTSTLGAMMKSAGLTGDVIVGMSTDMAGLAADMASFYNLDFDTAFQKIRAGISGETEPLKQLGINMSVANLNAFALQKGLAKTFEQMTQSEQIMLRYQYLMQATADAQGDFARTSDGFANASRLIETNLESLKTKLGEAVLPTVNELLNGLNGILASLTTEPDRTVLDEFADIDASTAAKLKDIQDTAAQARTLADILADMEKSSATTRTNMQDSAVVDIPDDTVKNARDLAGSLSEMAQTGNLSEKLGTKAVKEDAEAVSETFMGLQQETYSLDGKPIKKSVEEIKEDAAATGEEFMGLQQETYSLDGKPIHTSVKNIAKETGTIKDNFDATLQYGNHNLTADPIGKSVEKLATDSQQMRDNLNPENVGQTGIEETPLAQSVEKLGADATAAKEGLEGADAALQQIGEEGVPEGVTDVTEAVGDAAEATEVVSNATGEWLDVCKRLVQTMPGLSSIIDTQTGDVKGGAAAIDEYINSWERLQSQLTLIDANQRKHAALDAKYTELPALEVDKRVADYRLAKSREQLERYLKEFGFSGSVDDYAGDSLWQRHTFSNGENGINYKQAELLNKEINYYRQLRVEQQEATKVYNEQKTAYDEAAAALENEEAVLWSEMSAEEKATYITSKWAEAQQTAQAATETATEALQEYRKKALDEATKSVEKLVSSFKKVEAPKLEDMLKPDEMQAALQSQLDFMRQYQSDLAKLKEMGLDENLLAELSDGSKESAEYLRSLAEFGTENDVAKINEQYKAVTDEKKRFTETLADNTLAVDDAYNELVDVQTKAKEEQKRIEDEMAKQAGDSIAEMAENISANADGLQQAVNAVNSILGSLGIPTISMGIVTPDGQHEAGLNYVPFNGYLATLHEGEGILTAEENRVWQSFKAGQRGIDYDQLGGVMRDSIKPGGNVYLDGRVVGAVVSDRQGSQYRSLQRSGWQS